MEILGSGLLRRAMKQVAAAAAVVPAAATAVVTVGAVAAGLVLLVAATASAQGVYSSPPPATPPSSPGAPASSPTPTSPAARADHAQRAAAPAHDHATAALERHLDHAWESVSSYQATLTWPNPAGPRAGEHGHGLFLYQKPDRFLLEFHTPSPERYLVKGDTGWVWIVRLKQAVRYHLQPEQRAQVGLLILGQPSRELDRVYRLSAQPTAQDRKIMQSSDPALVLVPREPGSLAIRRAVMFLDPSSYLPRKLRLELESNEDLHMTVTQTSKNAPVDSSVWRMVLPPGTAVIDR